MRKIYFAGIFSVLMMMSACKMVNDIVSEFQDQTDENSQDSGKVKLIYNDNVPGKEGLIWYGVTESVPGYVEVDKGTSVTIPEYNGKLEKYSDGIKNAVFDFDSWNTKQDGSGDKYLSESVISMENDITLFAIFNTSPVVENGGDEDGAETVSVSLESMLIGKWIDDSNTLLLNPDFTGVLDVKAFNGATQHETFTWKAMTVSNGTKYLKVENCSDDALNKMFTIKKISASSMTLDGYFAVFSNKTTTWTKEL